MAAPKKIRPLTCAEMIEIAVSMLNQATWEGERHYQKSAGSLTRTQAREDLVIEFDFDAAVKKAKERLK